MCFILTRAPSQEIGKARNFAELRVRAQAVGPKRVGVVAAEDEVALSAAEAALELGIAVPVLIGNERKSGEKAEALRLSGLLTKAEFVNTDHPAPAAAR